MIIKMKLMIVRTIMEAMRSITDSNSEMNSAAMAKKKH